MSASRTQMEIDFEAGLTALYPEFMDVIRAAAHSCGRPMKSIAADMDKSQSELSRDLADDTNPNDPRNFKARDLPAFIKATGDRGKDVIYWLVEKYLDDPNTKKDRARDLLIEMAPMFQALMTEAYPEVVAKLKSVGEGK